MKDSFGDGTILYCDCISINIQVVISYYSFARCHHYGKLGKGKLDLCVLLLTIHVNLPIILNKNLIENIN